MIDRYLEVLSELAESPFIWFLVVLAIVLSCLAAVRR